MIIIIFLIILIVFYLLFISTKHHNFYESFVINKKNSEIAKCIICRHRVYNGSGNITASELKMCEPVCKYLTLCNKTRNGSLQKKVCSGNIISCNECLAMNGDDQYGYDKCVQNYSCL